MWKGPTLPMESLFPFGALHDHPNPPKHLIRKKIPRNDKLLEKARVLATLKHDCLIKLESAREENGDYYLLFQYVPMALEKWYLTVNREFIENYEQRLILFSRYLADKNILTTFRRENMGVSESGDAKYFLQLAFQQDSSVDKLALKKKYKEDIRQLIQYYIDRKNQVKQSNQTKSSIPEKKQNSKIMKILEAIEKGKANLCTEPHKEQSQALAVQQNTIADPKTVSKPIKNVQNVYIQKEVSKVNKIQVIVNSKPVDVLQHEFKREYASSSFYINGVPAVVLEREGEARRLLSPSDKFSRFQQVKYKEYKSMKTSGQLYVQDFINVLESDDADKLTLPGSPRATLTGSNKIAIQNGSGARNTMRLSPNAKQPLQPLIAIQPEENSSPRKQELKRKGTFEEEMKKMMSPKNGNISAQRAFKSEKQVKAPNDGSNNSIKHSYEMKMQPGLSNKTNELQKKVSQAITNSLNAINKFKSAKVTPSS